MIEANDIWVSYRGWKRKIEALTGFNLTVNQGDIFGLLGPNGAGKSTALYTILGLIKPDKGSVKVMNQELYLGSSLFQYISYLPEEAHYHLYLTVEEAIRYYAELYGYSISNPEIKNLMESFGMTEFKRLKLSQCSKGMKQKVGLIQVLLNHNAKIMFLDEPTRGLDPLTTIQFRDILLERNKNGVTIFLNSHILSEVEMICNRVAIMDKGRVIVQDELRKLLTGEQDQYEVEFEPSDAILEFITVTERSDSSVKGIINQKHLNEFFSFIQQKRLKLYQCTLKRTTLEQAFANIIKGASGEKTDSNKCQN